MCEKMMVVCDLNWDVQARLDVVGNFHKLVATVGGCY